MARLHKTPVRRRRRPGPRPEASDLAMLGHELRAPLAALASLVELIAAGGKSAESIRLAPLMRLASAQALAVADGLLAAETPERRWQATPEETDPAALAGELADLYDAALAAGGRRVRVEVGADVPRTITTDPVRLRQVLINLIENARRAAAGDIVIRLDGADGDRLIGFCIEDDGPGLADGFAIRAFQPGETSPGAGLGLWISRRLVDRLGGELTFAPRAPRGTAARFSIRRALGLSRRRPAGGRGRQPASAGSDDAAGDLAGLAVLIVDDNAVARLLMETMLTSFGARPQLAADGDAAVRHLEEGAPDVIVLDWSLSGERGGDVLDRLAATGRPLPPVVIVSAASRPPEEARRHAYLAKPFTPRELYATLLAVRERREAGGLAKA